MTFASESLRAGARARSLWAAALGAVLALSSGCDSEPVRLPTEAGGVRSPSSAAAEPDVERLPIIRIPRRRPGGATPTPTSTPAAVITPTATPSGPVTIRLRGISWQWDFYGPAASGGSRITLNRGQAYRIEFFNDGPEDGAFHTFSGISALGLSAVSLGPGESITSSFTPGQTGTFPFACTNSSCGIGHDEMTGMITVVP